MTLQHSVWRAYGATDAFGKDARGRTLRDDLTEWVMNDDVRAQLQAARLKAESQLKAHDGSGASATWEIAKASLQEQSRRVSLIDLYWWQRTMTLARARALWLPWVEETPHDVATPSRHRVDELEARLVRDFGPAVGIEELGQRITALQVAYNDERRKLAALVSKNKRAAGTVIASLDRNIPCPEIVTVTPSGKSAGDHGPKLLNSPSAGRYYPPADHINHIDGDVILRVAVDADGCMRHAEVVSSSGAPDLDDTALYLAEWATYGAAEKAGRAIDSALEFKYHFILDEDEPDTAGQWSPPLENAAGLLRSARQVFEQRQYDQAIDLLNRAIDLEPRNVGAISLRGLSHLWKRDNELARRDFDTASALNPNSIEVARGRGVLAARVPDPPAAIAQFTAILERDPKDTFALTWRAESYMVVGDLDRALADITECIRLQPKQVGFYERAAVYLRIQHKSDEVLHQAEAVVAANPDDAAAYRVAGFIYGDSKRDVEAMQSFDRAVEIAPKESAYLDRAQHRPRADLPGRKADIEAALKLNPGSRRATELLANMQVQAGDPAAAIATLSAVLTASPGADDLRLRRAIVYLKNDQLSSGEEDLAIARAHATNATALNEYCWELATAGVELEKALSACDAALALEPNLSAYLDSRGFVLLRMGRNADAIAAYDASLRAWPASVTSLYGRGLAKRRRGDAAGGEADIREALARNQKIQDRFTEYGL